MKSLPESTLIIVPHPDDEILLAGGIIYRCVLEHKEIHVAVATNGDYLCQNHDKGSLRLSESLDALGFLGVPPDHTYLLGYPDTGMESEVSFLTTLMNASDPDHVYPSPASAVTYGITGGKEDYHMERTGIHALYNARSFLEDVTTLIRSLCPQLIITTSRWDVHGDHSALLHFVRLAIKDVTASNFHYRPVLWEGIVHSPAGDDVWPIPEGSDNMFTMPPNLEEMTDLKWNSRISIPLPESAIGGSMESNKKYQALKRYHTALNPDEPEVVRYLLSFVKADEIFWEVSD